MSPVFHNSCHRYQCKIYNNFEIIHKSKSLGANFDAFVVNVNQVGQFRHIQKSKWPKSKSKNMVKWLLSPQTHFKRVLVPYTKFDFARQFWNLKNSIIIKALILASKCVSTMYSCKTATKVLFLENLKKNLLFLVNLKQKS